MIRLPRSTAPRVSIVIPASAGAEMLDACLASIERHGPTDVAYETIVVLNEAAPSDAAELLARTCGVDVISSPVNLGLAGAGNRGRARANGDFVLLLHDDAEVQPGWMEALVAAADAHPEAGAIGSKVLHLDGRLQNAGMVLWADATTTPPWISDAPTPDTFDVGRAVDYCGTSSLLVRAAVWDQIDGLDERFYPVYFVDVDLAMTLRTHGYVVRFEPSSLIAHHQGGGRSPWFRAFAAERNQALFRQKWAAELADHEPRDVAGDLDAQLARALQQTERTAETLRQRVRPDLPDGRPRRAIDVEAHDDEHRRRAGELQRAFTPFLLDALARLESDRSKAMAELARVERERDLVRSTARYPFGLELAFGLDGGAALFPVSGHHPAEAWGAWMGSAPCSLLLQPLWPADTDDLTPELELRVVHFVTDGRPMSNVRVRVNGHLVLDASGSSSEPTSHAALIPRAAFDLGGLLAVSIEADDAASPRALGINDDSRKLTVGLLSLVIRSRPDEPRT
jgi:GT2 family glycosyltransferase